MQVNKTTISQISLPSEPCSIQRKIQQAPSTMQSLKPQESCWSKISSFFHRLWQFLTCTKKTSVPVQNNLNWDKIVVINSRYSSDKDQLIKQLKNLKTCAFDTIGMLIYHSHCGLIFFAENDGKVTKKAANHPETTRFTQNPGKALVLVLPKSHEADQANNNCGLIKGASNDQSKTLGPYFDNKNKIVWLSSSEVANINRSGLSERLIKILETGHIPPNLKYGELSGLIAGSKDS